MLVILQQNRIPACLSWLTAEDQVLLRHEAVYLQSQLSHCAASVLVSNTDLAVRGMQPSASVQSCEDPQIHQLVLENPLSLCLS
ncbi:DsrH/TusB family sulfur metabolism protein [Rheinheimera sp.]|uniref:DsrH/TusB family sulfur metabolism protein n=1 Tax=Rheinheimera sp. TaxID=1869214 RepID=UPI00307F6835